MSSQPTERQEALSSSSCWITMMITFSTMEKLAQSHARKQNPRGIKTRQGNAMCGIWIKL